MKNIFLFIFFLQCLSIQSQDITIMFHISKELQIENVEDRNLGELKNIKLVNEGDGINSLSYNLNTTIGWTAYPPISSIKKDIKDIQEDKSILISKVYEFTFETK